MYYEAQASHGLAHDPFKAIIAPRPIGWISTIDNAGVPNLAPYSFFNALSSSPPMLMFSSETLKDSARNARDTGEFVFSLATETLRHAMNTTSDTVPASQNEYVNANLVMGKCNLVSVPRVEASPASMECVTLSCNELKDQHGKPVDTFLVIGQVVGIHINDDYINNGRFDTAAANPLARCGYRDYASVSEVFEIMRPTDAEAYDGIDR